MDESIGVRVQWMSMSDQTLVLASIASGRSEDGTFSYSSVLELFYETSLPAPAKIENAFSTLKRGGSATPAKADGAWSLTPLGRMRVSELFALTPPR